MCEVLKESFINSKILANYFKGMCKNFLPPYRSDSISINRNRAKLNIEITQFLSQVKKLAKEGKCDEKVLRDDVVKINKVDLIHIEILWYLQEYQLLSLEEIFLHHESHKNEDIIEHISSNLFCCLVDYKSNPSEIRKKIIISYYQAAFCRIKSGESILEGSFQHSFLNLILSKLKEYYESEFVGSTIYQNSIDLPFIIKLFKEANLTFTVISSILLNFFDALMCKTLYSIKSVFDLQESKKDKIKNEKITEFFSVLFSYCELNTLINKLKVLLTEKPKILDWKKILPLIIYIGTSFKEGWKEIKCLCNFLLQESFRALDTRLLSFTFLIVRQCCFEKSKHCFNSYLQWFGSTFSTQLTTPVKSKEKCVFFFEFLTNLISSDSVYYLKIHLNKIPWVPQECQFIVEEYESAVQSKLCDLNASTELGFCENTTGKSAAVFDVESVIEHFEKTKTILNSVFQASMFSKNYYEQKFLVELTSKFEGKNCARHKIIMKLNSLHKIPKTIYQKYQLLKKKSTSK